MIIYAERDLCTIRILKNKQIGANIYIKMHLYIDWRLKRLLLNTLKTGCV